MWRAWIWARLAVPAALLLVLMHREYGTAPQFWAATLFLVGVIAGAWFVLRDLYRRELGTAGRGRRR